MGVINEEIKINKVKKKVVIQRLKQLGLKTFSELNAILPEKQKVTVVSQEENKEGDEIVE